MYTEYLISRRHLLEGPQAGRWQEAPGRTRGVCLARFARRGAPGAAQVAGGGRGRSVRRANLFLKVAMPVGSLTGLPLRPAARPGLKRHVGRITNSNFVTSVIVIS
jgi:hypothetical protein